MRQGNFLPAPHFGNIYKSNHQESMEYLVHKNKTNNKAHIWNPDKGDTVCEMYSTGGLADKQNLAVVHFLPLGTEVCNNCKQSYENEYGSLADAETKQQAFLSLMLHISPYLYKRIIVQDWQRHCF